MDKCLQVIAFHDSLHGFFLNRGTGTATMKAKLVQQPVYLEQQALYIVFIDLWKAYDVVDCGRCLEILEEYRVKQNILRLISYFWDNAELFCLVSG